MAQFVNRNPRNLEMMGLQARPSGYGLEDPRTRRCFIYKVGLVQSSSHMDAQLTHYKNGVVLSASTREKSISSQLYSNVDTCAAMNLGRVLALRCLMSGIHFAVAADTDDIIKRSQHLKAFYECLVSEGLTLDELPHIEHDYRTDRNFTFERYEVKHTQEDKTDE